MISVVSTWCTMRWQWLCSYPPPQLTVRNMWWWSVSRVELWRGSWPAETTGCGPRDRRTWQQASVRVVLNVWYIPTLPYFYCSVCLYSCIFAYSEMVVCDYHRVFSGGMYTESTDRETTGRRGGWATERRLALIILVILVAMQLPHSHCMCRYYVVTPKQLANDGFPTVDGTVCWVPASAVSWGRNDNQREWRDTARNRQWLDRAKPTPISTIVVVQECYRESMYWWMMEITDLISMFVLTKTENEQLKKGAHVLAVDCFWWAMTRSRSLLAGRVVAIDKRSSEEEEKMGSIHIWSYTCTSRLPHTISLHGKVSTKGLLAVKMCLYY